MRAAEKKTTGRFTIEFDVANNEDILLARRGFLEPAKVRRMKVQGVVDSGATRLVLPESVVKRLGLSLGPKVQVRYTDRRSAKRDTAKNVHVEIMGREGTFTALCEPRRRTALVGAIVLEDLDYLVDCTNQRLFPRDPRFIISEIE